MSFMDVIKEKSAKGNGVHPTMPGGNPFATKAAPKMPNVTAGAKPSASPFAKNSPFSVAASPAPSFAKTTPKVTTPTPAPKAEEETKVEAKVDETKATTTVEDVKVEAAAEENKATNAVEEAKVEEATEEIKGQVNLLDAIKEADAEPAVEEVKEEAVEPAKAEAPVEKKAKAKTTRARATKSKAKAEAEVAVSEDKEEEIVEQLFKMPRNTKSYEELVGAIMPAQSEDWLARKKELIAEFDCICIEKDATDAEIKSIIAQIAALKQKIAFELNAARGVCNVMSNNGKTGAEGIIERIKLANMKGSSDAERKKNAVLAVMNYRDEDGSIVNYFELYDMARIRLDFYEALNSNLDFKKSCIETMNWCNKRISD